MSNSSVALSESKINVFSQSGEDGVIARILELIPHTDKWCVEFGAWDGRHLSNTRQLIETVDYSAILIEGSKSRFEDLQKNYADNKKIIPINKFVGFDKDDNLDHILSQTSIPKNFDLLSIDIDGNDYNVWQAMEKFHPKVVCIEFNPTIPTEVIFIQPKDPNLNQGSSLRAIVELGKKKGYELVAVLTGNAFFVRSEYFPFFNITDNRPEILRTDLRFVSYIFSGYDGTVLIRGYSRLPWHGLDLLEKRSQILPKILRTYHENYSFPQKAFLLIFLLFRYPKIFIKRVKTFPDIYSKRLLAKIKKS